MFYKFLYEGYVKGYQTIYQLSIWMSVVKQKSICFEERFTSSIPSGTETTNICKTMGQHIIFTPTAHCWFNRFNNRNYELDNSSRFVRPVEVDLDRFIEDDPRLITRC